MKENLRHHSSHCRFAGTGGASKDEVAKLRGFISLLHGKSHGSIHTNESGASTTIVLLSHSEGVAQLFQLLPSPPTS